MIVALVGTKWRRLASSTLRTLSLSSRYLTSPSHVEIEDFDGIKRRVTYLDTGALSNSVGEESAPPLVFLMGTAQTIPAYTANIQALSRKHRLLIFELRGQGTTELDSSMATTQQQIRDVKQIVGSLVGDRPVNLAGYSFGGRVALAFAAHYPNTVHKLSITGVPLQRSATGRLIVRSWEEALQRGHLRECAWSLVLNGYSDEMLSKMEKKLDTNIDYLVANNRLDRLYDLIRLSHEKDPNSAFAVPACAARVSCPVQVIAGQFDRIAGYQATLDLAAAIPGSEVVTFESGHSVPFEKTSQWCHAVSQFFLK